MGGDQGKNVTGSYIFKIRIWKWFLRVSSRMVLELVRINFVIFLINFKFIF